MKKVKIHFIIFLSLIVLCFTYVIKVKDSRINIDIDASDETGTFQEKVLYSLSFDDNELKSVNLDKILPKIDSQFFDIQVNSKDVRILKYEVKNITSDYCSNCKVLNLLFEPINNYNYNQGVVNIQYSYKIKETEDYNETKIVKSSFYLKDVGFLDQGDNKNDDSSYPAEFSIVIRNIPDNFRVKGIEYNNSEIELYSKNNYKRNANLKGNNFIAKFKKIIEGGEGKKIKNIHFITEEHNQTSALSNKNAKTLSILKRVNNTNEDSTIKIKESTLFLKKKTYPDSITSLLDFIMAALMILGICFLCCNCCVASLDSHAYTKEEQLCNN